MPYAFTRREKKNLEAACEFMARELHRRITLAEICREAQMNRNKLNRGFHKFYQVTVRSYLLSLRMQKAKMLLQETDLTLWEVAGKTGYAHYHNFLTQYKKFHGYPAKREPRDLCGEDGQ